MKFLDSSRQHRFQLVFNTSIGGKDNWFDTGRDSKPNI